MSILGWKVRRVKPHGSEIMVKQSLCVWACAALVGGGDSGFNLHALKE